MLDMSHPKSFAGRPAEKAELLGQIATPPAIADMMARRLLGRRPNGAIEILDPCVGECTFPLAIVSSGLLEDNDRITAIDIDPEMVALSKGVWPTRDRNLECFQGDYLKLPLDAKYDYAIINPPYIRQEWLDEKEQLRDRFEHQYGVRVPGTSNLYVYFVVKVVADLRPGGEFACIVYDSWQFTLYGEWLLKFLHAHCRSLDVDVIPDQPFHGRLIDATVIYGVKRDGGDTQDVDGMMSQLLAPKSPLSHIEGFRRLSSIFSTRRGLRLKQASFFLCDLDECAELGATPFIKKVSRLKELYRVSEEHPEAALLLAPGDQKPAVMSELVRRLEAAKQAPEENASILTWFRERPNAWFLHPEAPYAPIVFNYYIRNRPRHIANPARAYSDNFYGLQPPDGVSHSAWLAVLNSTAVCTEVMAHSRNQGSGLAKIQLFEYRKVCVPDLRECSDVDLSTLDSLGSDLVERPRHSRRTLRRIDELVSSSFSDPLLIPARIAEVFNAVDFRARRPKGK